MMGLFSSTSMKETSNKGKHLYYTDRLNEYQYGDSKRRLEAIWKADPETFDQLFVLRELPANRRLVEHDIADVKDHGEFLEQLAVFAYNNPKLETRLSLTGYAEGIGKLSNPIRVAEAYVVIENNHDTRDGVCKAYVVTDDEGRTAGFQVVAKGESVCYAELEYNTDKLHFEDDETVIKMPLAVAMSSNEQSLLMFLNTISTGTFKRIAVSGELFR